LIFSQQVSNWSDLGAYFTSQPVVACLRHAGSGDHSTLDMGIMNSSWGGVIATAETPGSVWFNQTTYDEMRCINGATPATPGGSLIGAIGYADADQAVYKDKNGFDVANAQNVRQLKYNGFYPTRTAIRNGLYDLYSNAWLYTNPANGGIINTLAAYLAHFLQNPANVPAWRANYWATQGEMKYNRNPDNSYPSFVGAATPQLP
jgi:ABC-type phosphate transport system substrate-binding protein